MELTQKIKSASSTFLSYSNLNNIPTKNVVMRGWLKIIVLIALLTVICGCKAEIVQVVIPPPIPEEQRLAVDYLFMLDNSGSIPPQGREFAREVIKLFVELAEEGDKVAIIVFDTTASLLVNRVINSQEDREDIKAQVEQGLTFQGQYTDISQAFIYTRDHYNRLFRGAGYHPVVILMSDGKLEPQLPRTVGVAYNDIMFILGEVGSIPFYTIGLGNTEIYDEFLPGTGINGWNLLNNMAEATRGRFYHASSVDELIDTYLRILRVIEGRSGETGRYVFRVDESTEKISIIITKRTTSEVFCITSDITLRDPKNQKITSLNHTNYPFHQEHETTIRWQSSSYYDLIVVEQPITGEWRVDFREDERPPVASILKTLINLRYDVRRSYLANEEKRITTWLYDERTNGVSLAPYQVMAKLDKAENFDESHRAEIPLQRTENGIYVLTLKEEENFPLSLGEYKVQITAENKETFFYRVSEPIPFTIEESWFEFDDFPQKTFTKRPWWKGIPFYVDINTAAENYPRFEKDPQVYVHLERIGRERYPLPSISLVRGDKVEEERLSYSASLRELRVGRKALLDTLVDILWPKKKRCTGQYILEGTLTTGEGTRIRSESFSFIVKTWWVWYVLRLIILGFIIWWIFWKTETFHPRLVGILNIITPVGYKPRSVNLRKNKKAKGLKWGRGGEYLELGRGKPLLSDLKEVSIRFEAYREKKKKRVRMRVLGGTVNVNGQYRKCTDIIHGNEITFSDGGNFKIRVNAPELRKPIQRTTKIRRPRSR